MVVHPFENPKRAFVEALIISIVIFIIGIILGMSFESSRLDRVNDYYSASEVSIIDSIALGRLSDIDILNCDEINELNIQLADKIYEESYELQKYEDSGKITDNLKLVRKKYDVLRTLLWINVIKSNEKCNSDISSVVYLYEFQPESLEKRALQIVWSRVLFDLKQQEGNKIILIPISVSSNITSLDSLIKTFNITDYPVVIVNEKAVLYNIESVEDIEKYLK